MTEFSDIKETIDIMFVYNVSHFKQHDVISVSRSGDNAWRSYYIMLDDNENTKMKASQWLKQVTGPGVVVSTAAFHAIYFGVPKLQICPIYFI